MSAWLLAALVVAAPRPFDPAQVDRMGELAALLRKHVAELDVTLPVERGQPLLDPSREGYAAVWSERELVCLSFVVDGARSVQVIGPGGKLPAKVVLVDHERRVAVVRTEAPLASIGLAVPLRAPPAARKRDEVLFALVGTDALAHVIHGVILDEGDAPELERHPRISLTLALGMPVFDRLARLVGYARAVAWDKDKAMIVTPEHVLEARTATTTAASPASPSASPRPWWAR